MITCIVKKKGREEKRENIKSGIKMHHEERGISFCLIIRERT